MRQIGSVHDRRVQSGIIVDVFPAEGLVSAGPDQDCRVIFISLLYKLVLEVCDGEGRLQEVIPVQVGFRRFEIADGLISVPHFSEKPCQTGKLCLPQAVSPVPVPLPWLLKLNGQRIVFKGVNRHEFSSRTGRVPNDTSLVSG